jgi:hypothetical protein
MTGVEPWPPQPWPTPPAPYVPPGYTRDDPLIIAAGWSTNRKEGVWTAPPFIKLQGDWGTIMVDFQGARPTSTIIEVQVVGGAGSMTLIVPEGWAAQLDRLQPGMGSRKSTILEQPVAGQPLLVLSGAMGLGSLSIRYPNRGDQRRLERNLAKERAKLR